VNTHVFAERCLVCVRPITVVVSLTGLTTMVSVIALGKATRGPNMVSDASFALAGERVGAAVVTLRCLPVFVVRKVHLDLFTVLGVVVASAGPAREQCGENFFLFVREPGDVVQVSSGADVQVEILLCEAFEIVQKYQNAAAPDFERTSSSR